MNINLSEEFNKHFLNYNRINHVEDFSETISIDEIINLNTNKISIGNKNIDIPVEVLDEVEYNNVKIDAYSNDESLIYYLDSLTKKYYQIGEEISISDYNLSINDTLRFELTNKKSEDLILNYVVIEYSDQSGIVARKYDDLNNISIVPHSQTRYLKIFITPENAGFLYNVHFNIKNMKMNTINDYQLKVDSEIIYNPDHRVMLEEISENLMISVPELNKKFIYFSYGIENNSFNKVPESSLIKINPDNLYQISSPYIMHDEVDFTPTLIEYNVNGKTNLIKLTAQGEFIKFQKDTTAIRLSYRFSGSGKVEIEPVSVVEYESETNYEQVRWTSRYEVDVHMNTIKNLGDLRIAAIMDEFTYHSYQYEANLHRLSFNNWKNEIISFMPHFIFIESSWHGNNGEWSKKIAYITEEKHKDIRNLISFAKTLNIPVIFWNKEDPVHYDHFIETAKLCDFVFTTDQNRVDDYKLACNHENVEVLQFAAQPKIHNPIKIQKERVNGISFAGSYYGLREERSKDMNRLFRAAIPYNLYIYDRNYEFTKNGDRLNFIFPEEFRKYILGSLPFYQIDKAYKGYKFMININTVKTSPTMYARRVYEGLASGTPIISNYSLGMENQFGDIIGSSEKEEDLLRYLDNLNNNPNEYNKVKQLGIRKVIQNHTYTNRLLQITKSLGYNIDSDYPTVTVISFIEHTYDIDTLIETYNKMNYKNKSLIIILENDDDSYSVIESNITFININEFGNNFSTLDNLVSSDFITLLDAKDFYGENYINDLLLSVKYTNAQIIGKNNYYESDKNQIIEVNSNSEHEFTDSINLSSSVIKTSLFSNISLEDCFDFLTSRKSISDLNYLGLKIFSNDKMNYIKNGNYLSNELKSKVII